MPTIKVRDLAYVRLGAPDLDAMEEFLTHFGLTRAARTPKALYMRGTDPTHHLHVTEKADDASFVGFAYHAAGEGDLTRVATAPGASPVEAIDEPGGGRRVRLREPNGYQIEVVWGLEALPSIPVDYTPMNTGAEPLRRAGTLMRLRKSPTPIKRIGHGVFGNASSRPRGGSATRWVSSARMTCTWGPRTTSSARSTAAIAGTSTWIITRCSA
jgi:catechol 2,3-dioxygenase-like lactoylglutathione lyase family enzyme